MLDHERLGLLGLVGVLRATVDLELGEHLATQPVLREHAADGAAHGLVGTVGEGVAVGTRLEATRVAGVVVDHLVAGLGTGQHDLVGVDDDDVVARVEVGREDGLVLAAEDGGDLAGQAAEHEALGVDDVPGTLDLAGLGGVGGHGIPLGLNRLQQNQLNL